MATLFDKSGKPVEVDDAHVTQALLSGEYGTDKASVAVKTQGGDVYNVPTANLAKFSQGMGGGVHVLSDAEAQQHAAEKQKAEESEKYGGLGSQAAVLGAGVASGATLGLSDAALSAVLSDQQRQSLEASRRVNSGLNTGAQIGGALLPALLSGGESAPESIAELGAEGATAELGAGAKVANALRGAVTAPSRALESLSGLAERGTAGVVGTDAESFMGQLAQRAIAKAAGGAVTGAGATAGMDLGENQLSTDHNLTGEQLLSDMGIGALMGGGVGALGGLGGKALERFATPATEGVEGAAPEAGGVGDKIREALKTKSNEWYYGATGARAPEIKRLNASGLEAGDVGEWMHDNLSNFTDNGKAPVGRDAIAAAADRAVDEAGPAIGNSIKALDDMHAQPAGAPIFDRVRSEVLQPLEDSIDPRVQNVGQLVGKITDNAEKKFNADPTFQNLFDLRREIDKSINFTKSDPAQVTANKILRQARGVVEDELGKQGEAIAGPEWKSGYDAAKNQYRMASAVGEAIEGSEPRLATNNKVGLTDTILAAHGLGAMAAGHPLGLLAGLAGGVVNHVMKQYGDAVGAVMLRKMAETGAFSATVVPAAASRMVASAQRSYSQALTRGVAALTRGELAANAPGRPKTPEGDFAQKSKAVQAMLAAPQQHTQQINANAQALGPTFATVGSAYQRAAMTTSFYLASQMPKAKPIHPDMPKAGKIEPTNVEKAKFNKVFDAVAEPTSLLHEAAKGTLTRDQIDAVTATHPAILKDMQSRVTSELKMLKEPLAPATMAGVKMLLGEPVFDHPIAPLPPPAPPQPQAQGGAAGKRPKSATSRPLKLDTAQVGLVGSRSPSY